MDNSKKSKSNSKNNAKPPMGSSELPSYVSLIPQSTQTFRQNQRAIIEVPTDIVFFDGKVNHVSLDILNTSTDKSRWTFPLTAGAQSLIERIDVYSLATGQHLETLENYNEWTSCEIQYLNSSFDKEQTLEGVGNPPISYNETNYNGYVTPSPYDVYNNQISPVTVNNDPVYQAYRVTFPLKLGIFKAWGEHKLVPNLFFQGLRIELSFARNTAVCCRLGAISDDDEIRTYDDNSLNKGGGADTQSVLVTNISTGSPIVDFDKTFATAMDTGLVVGNQIILDDGTGTVISQANTLITAITETQITLSKNPTANGQGFVTVPASNASYEVQNLEFKVLKYTLDPQARMEMIKDMSKNGFEYEFISYDMYPDNIPQTVKRHNSDINTVASKALAIFSKLVLVNNEFSPSLKSYYQGIIPDDNKLNAIQYFINGRLYPVQSYNPEKTEERVIVYNELQKAWASLNKSVKRFGSYEGSAPENYSNTFLFARQLADKDFYFDLVNTEPQLRLEFSDARSNSVGNLALRHFVFSKKTIVIDEIVGLQVLN